jgi:hypothetical protein
MFAAWCVLFDVSILAAHALTNGRYPSLAKVIVCTAITVAANAYCFWTEREHRACRIAMRRLTKDGIERTAITVGQATIVVVVVMAVSALFAWVFFFIDG